MSLNKASIAVALAAFLAVGGIAGQALAAPHDGHDGHWRQQRSYQGLHLPGAHAGKRSTMPS